VIILAVFLLGCQTAEVFSARAPGEQLESVRLPAEDWKVLLVAGSYTDEDEQIFNWDRAVSGMQDWLLSQGVQQQNIRLLSSMPSLIGTQQKGTEILPTEERFIEQALADLDIEPGEPVMIYISSHGGKNQGIWLERRPEFLSNFELKELLDNYLPDNPAVLLLSACYSGQFILGEVEGEDYYDKAAPVLVSDQRIILTAARNDRSSFGCGAGSEMPVWDAALLEAVQASESSSTWQDISLSIKAYIKGEESSFEESSRSYPQASVPKAIDADLSGLFASP
jgi:hypothetical protein